MLLLCWSQSAPLPLHCFQLCTLSIFSAGPPNSPALPPGTALARMVSNFPGPRPLQDGEGEASSPAGLPPLGRYTSVLNDGLFNSLQVKISEGFSPPMDVICFHCHLGCCAAPEALACFSMLSGGPKSHRQASTLDPARCVVQVRQGSIIDDLAESEPTYLANQNKELRRLLVECRKELYEVCLPPVPPALQFCPFDSAPWPFDSAFDCAVQFASSVFSVKVLSIDVQGKTSVQTRTDTRLATMQRRALSCKATQTRAEPCCLCLRQAGLVHCIH